MPLKMHLTIHLTITHIHYQSSKKNCKRLDNMRNRMDIELPCIRGNFVKLELNPPQFLKKRFEGLPVDTHTDAAGNFWATLRGEKKQELLMGGHIDLAVITLVTALPPLRAGQVKAIGVTSKAPSQKSCDSVTR